MIWNHDLTEYIYVQMLAMFLYALVADMFVEKEILIQNFCLNISCLFTF